MPHIFIAGVSRGIGLRLAQQYAGEGWTVWGIGRSPAPDEQVPNLHYASANAGEFEVGDVAELRRVELTRVILNSAIFGPNPPNNLDVGAHAVAQVLNNNVVAHYRVFKQLLPHISTKGDAKIGFIISLAGVHSRIKGRNAIGYRVSKSAQIALALSLVDACRAHNIGVYLINPGWVRTRIGGKNARLDAAESAANVRAVIESASFDETGTAYNFDGKKLQL
jgi:NAD(P)-dependent dehydrogenase (short-subunit alcohol dehydrogenase family)